MHTSVNRLRQTPFSIHLHPVQSTLLTVLSVGILYYSIQYSHKPQRQQYYFSTHPSMSKPALLERSEILPPKDTHQSTIIWYVH